MAHGRHYLLTYFQNGCSLFTSAAMIKHPDKNQLPGENWFIWLTILGYSLPPQGSQDRHLSTLLIRDGTSPQILARFLVPGYAIQLSLPFRTSCRGNGAAHCGLDLPTSAHHGDTPPKTCPQCDLNSSSLRFFLGGSRLSS